jgi:hypothetical protein
MMYKRFLVYFGYYDNSDYDNVTKIGKTEYLYGRMCNYNTSHPFKDFKVYFLIEVNEEYLNELEQICHDEYDYVKAKHSPEYKHRNEDNEWITIRPTRDEIERKLVFADIPFDHKILSEEEISEIEKEIREVEHKQRKESELKKEKSRERVRQLRRTAANEQYSWNEREYQTEIITHSIKQLALSGKIYIELATGAGKTYLFYRIAENLSPKIIVAFSSRVDINNQNVNKKYLSLLNREYAVFDCSNMGDYDVFSRNNEYHIIVACIHSCDKVYNMLRGGDLDNVCIWFDEAHYGVEKWIDDTSEAKQFLLKDARISNRIFTSASPDMKHVESYPDVFGKLYKPIKVSRLIELGWLCGITPYIFGTDTNSGNINDYNLKHFRDYGASFGFSFHNSRDNAFVLFKNHYESYKSGATRIKPFFLVGDDYKNDEMTNIDLDYDYRSVSIFKQQPSSIAYICDMYKMGFDFDELDYLIFSDPKFSWQEIIQCIGRGTRSDKKGDGGINLVKKLKTLLPVFVHDNETKYDNIVNVLQYLVYDADIMPNSIEMDFGIGTGTKTMRMENTTYDGAEDPKAVILDLVTRKQLKWKHDDFVSLLQKHDIHTREDYNTFCDEYIHLSLPEHPGRIELLDFTWEQTYQTSPYYSEEECREKIVAIMHSNDDLELDEMDNPGEYLHEQDNKIPPIDYKGFYGTDPPF